MAGNKAESQNNKPVSIVQLVLTVLLVGAAFAIGSMWTELKTLKGKNENNAAPAQQEAAADPQQPEDQPLTDELWQEILIDPVYAEGDANAPVTIVEFTDYQCPFCKRHFDQTEGQLSTEYIKTGKVRWLIRDLPLSFHQNAGLAAEAARCAADQDGFKAMHSQLFSTQTAWGESDTAAALFTGYAKSLGLNGESFSACLSSGKFKDAVAADLALATKVGANGTPTFYINGQPLIGAQPFTAFKALIDAELN